jgi:hypothetical protein
MGCQLYHRLTNYRAELVLNLTICCEAKDGLGASEEKVCHDRKMIDVHRNVRQSWQSMLVARKSKHFQ